MGFAVNVLSPAGAAEVVGLDYSRSLSPEDLAALKRAFLQSPILATRDQRLTPQQQAAFARQLGPIEPQDRSPYTHPDDCDILILSNEIRPDGTAVGIVDADDFWHSDSSHIPEPCQTTILDAVRNPSRGGDTELCNMYMAGDSLPDAPKRRIKGRSGTTTSARPRTRASSSRRIGRAPETIMKPAPRKYPKSRSFWCALIPRPAARHSTSRRGSPSESPTCRRGGPAAARRVVQGHERSALPFIATSGATTTSSCGTTAAWPTAPAAAMACRISAACTAPPSAATSRSIDRPATPP